MTGETHGRYKRWFWRPPRAHGEVIAAAGAGMVSVIGHAHDASTPAGTGWLLAAAVAMGLLSLIVTERAILSTLWFFAVSRFLRADAWGQP